MTADQVQAMVRAIAEAGLDLDDVRGQAGIAEGQTPTLAQGRKVKQIIATA